MVINNQKQYKLDNKRATKWMDIKLKAWLQWMKTNELINE